MLAHAVTTATEYQREDLWSVVAANWNRVQQALRSLEEYAKVIAPQAAPQLEALRYRAYAVERTVTILSTSVERLAAARLYVLVDGRSSIERVSPTGRTAHPRRRGCTAAPRQDNA